MSYFAFWGSVSINQEVNVAKELSLKSMSASQLKILLKYAKECSISSATTLIYHGHRPISAIYISSGEVYLKKLNKVVATIGPGKLIAFEEYINKTVLKVDIEAGPSTVIYWLSNDLLQKII